MSTVPEKFLASITVEQTIVWPISTLSAMYLVYGFYILLFGTYVYMICSNERIDKRRRKSLYFVLTTALFAITTIYVVIETTYWVHASIVRFNILKNEDFDLFMRYQTWNDVQRRLGFTTSELAPVVLNILADLMLIHRCYCIWDSNKLVGVPLIVISVLVNALGLVWAILEAVGLNALARDPNAASLLPDGETIGMAYIISSTISNLIITLLTAGRIWWIHRQFRLQATSVYTSDKFVQSVSRYILESGILYPIISVIALILSNTVSTAEFPFDFSPLVVLSAGIAPTLIMVRALSGKNVESLQEAVSEIRFSSQLAQQRSEGTTAAESQVQVRSIGYPGVVDGSGVGTKKEMAVPV